jgi:PAB-dependent poly(A)-specific ribonuclease subunit 2
VPPTAFTLPPSIPHQPLFGAVPPNAGHVAPEALPVEGDLAAIDAEFVVAAPERAKTLPDGSRRLVAAARNMPGRVTVVTPERAAGDGDCEEALGNAGASARVRTLMDEYTVATERVWDHLTRFSGINPGDLDTATSPYRLHAYKATYLRLRALLDGGAVLVGHGLRKDARELNIFVPSTQAADTVRLWKLPQQRYLSLRFLASHLLGLDIQGNVHDSKEDALVALRLYQAWARVRSAAGLDGVERLTHALYQVGRTSGWRAAGAAAHSSTAGASLTPAEVAAAALTGAGVSDTVIAALGLGSKVPSK